MLDEITTTVIAALNDWVHWETWLRWATAAGLAYALPRGAWWMAKDVGKLAWKAAELVRLDRPIYAVGRKARAWWRKPGRAAQAEMRAARVEERLDKLLESLGGDGRPRVTAADVALNATRRG